MNLQEFKKHFKQEVSERYSASESDFIYRFLVKKMLGFDDDQWKFQHQKLSDKDQKNLQNAISELKTGKPYQQILGETEFYGMKFFVDENVLIPRPETEELLEFAIREIQNSMFKSQVKRTKSQVKRTQSQEIQNPKFKVPRTTPPPSEGVGGRILDIGTGSGIIPIVLKKHFPDAEIFAMDISEKALEIARKNAEFHQVEIHFFQQDYLNSELNEKYDIIISNPPYIGIDEENEIAENVKNFEPNIALFSPVSDSFIFYRKIAKDAKNFLNKNGMIFLETNQKTGKETLEIFKNFPEKQLLKDISGNDRILLAVNA
jgi:release factor glutamine methyltransferase